MLRGVAGRLKTEETEAEQGWKARPKRVKVPYAKSQDGEPVPEYRRTREIRWEAGGTTPQA